MMRLTAPLSFCSMLWYTSIVVAKLARRKSAGSMYLLRPPPNKIDAGWSSPVAREAHNLEVAGSNPVPAINSTKAA